MWWNPAEHWKYYKISGESTGYILHRSNLFIKQHNHLSHSPGETIIFTNISMNAQHSVNPYGDQELFEVILHYRLQTTRWVWRRAKVNDDSSIFIFLFTLEPSSNVISVHLILISIIRSHSVNAYVKGLIPPTPHGKSSWMLFLSCYFYGLLMAIIKLADGFNRISNLVWTCKRIILP